MIKIQETQHSKDKKKKLSHFNIEPYKDFINDANKKAFGHKCDLCNNKLYCHKWKNAIVIVCSRFKQKENRKSYFKK